MAKQEDEFCMPNGKEFLKLPFARHCICYVDLQYCNSDIRRQRYNRINKKKLARVFNIISLFWRENQGANIWHEKKCLYVNFQITSEMSV